MPLYSMWIYTLVTNCQRTARPVHISKMNFTCQDHTSRSRSFLVGSRSLSEVISYSLLLYFLVSCHTTGVINRLRVSQVDNTHHWTLFTALECDALHLTMVSCLGWCCGSAFHRSGDTLVCDAFAYNMACWNEQYWSIVLSTVTCQWVCSSW